MNKIALENFITTCDEMMIAQEGASLDAWKIYVSKDFKSIKTHYKNAKKYLKANMFKETEAELNKCVMAVRELKKRVDEIPENDSKVANFFSHLNPLLLFIKNSELTSVTPGVGLQFGSSGGAYGSLTFNYTSYTDELSRSTPNAVKRDVQLALNLITKQCGDALKKIGDKKRQLQRKRDKEKNKNK